MRSSYMVERLIQAGLTIFVVISLTFGMIRLMPGGPMEFLQAQLLEEAGQVDQERIARQVEMYVNVNPQEPILDQYISYMISTVQGDLGVSMWHNDPVNEIIADALPWTVFIMGISIILTFGIGISLGAVMAYREGSMFDVSTSGSSILLNSIPYYIAAIVLVFVLGHQMDLLPIGGRMESGTTPGINWPFIKGVTLHAAMPITSVVITAFGGWAISMRGNSVQVLGEDYLRVARLRGLPSNHIAIRYVARNAILPLYTGLMIAIGFMFGGSVILEEIFSYPGVGYYMFQSISARDYPLMMGCFLVITIAVVIGVLIADLTYGKLDPRAGGGNREAY